jgi:hypothetical protein
VRLLLLSFVGNSSARRIDEEDVVHRCAVDLLPKRILHGHIVFDHGHSEAALGSARWEEQRNHTGRAGVVLTPPATVTISTAAVVYSGR